MGVFKRNINGLMDFALRISGIMVLALIHNLFSILVCAKVKSLQLDHPGFTHLEWIH